MIAYVILYITIVDNNSVGVSNCFTSEAIFSVSIEVERKREAIIKATQWERERKREIGKKWKKRRGNFFDIDSIKETIF